MDKPRRPLKMLLVSVLLVAAGCGEAVPDTPLERGRAHYAQNRWDEAIAEFTAAIDAGTDVSEALLLRGKALLAKGETHGSIEDFTRLIELEPDGHQAYYERSRAYRELGNTQLASADYNAGKQRDPVGWQSKLAAADDVADGERMRQLLRSAGNKPPRPASEDATAPSDSSHRFDPSYPFDPIGEDQQEGAEPDSDTSPLPGAGYGGIATSGRLDKRKKAIEQSQARRREQLQDRIARESAESGNPFDGDGFGGLALPATDGPGLPGVDGLKLPGAGDLTTPSVLPKLPDNSQFNRGGFKLPTAEPFKLSPGGISSHVPGGIGGGLPLPERTGAEIQPPADGPLVGRPPDRRTTPDGSPGAEETSPSVIPGGQLNRYANPPAQSPLNPYAPPEVNISGLDLNPYRLLPRGEQNLNPYLPAPEGTTTFNPYRRRDRPATNINPYQPRRQPNLSMNPYLPITGPLAGQTGASPGAAPGLPRTGRGGSPTP